MIPCPDTDAIKSYTDRSAARRESPQRFAIASMQFRHVVAARVSYPEVGSVKSNELRLRPNRESPGQSGSGHVVRETAECSSSRMPTRLGS